jgi:hypothetical protein
MSEGPSMGEYEEGIGDPPAPHVWTTREGERIPVEQMTDAHLANAVAFLKRRIADLDEESDAAAGWGGSGDMSSYYADQSMFACFAESVQIRDGWLSVLEAEQKRRRKP